MSGAGFTAWAASPPPIGDVAPSTGAFTTLSASGGNIDAVTLGATTGVVVDRMTLGGTAAPIPGRIAAYDTGSGVPFISLWASSNFSAGIVTGINTEQYASGTLPVSTSGSYNGFAVLGDDVDFKGGTGSAFGVELLFGGNNTTGSRVASQITMSLTATTKNQSAGYSSAFYVGELTQLTANVNDGGVSGSPYGSLLGINPNVQLQNGATYWNSISAAEFDVTVQAGASIAYKHGISVVQTALDAVQGSDDDSAVAIGGQAGCVGWKYVISIGGPEGVRAMNSGTTIMYVQNSGFEPTPVTIKSGIDFTNVAFSAAAFKSNGFLVDGSGNVTADALTVGNTDSTTPAIAFVANEGGVYPTQAFGGAIGANFNGGQKEVDFWNTNSSPGTSFSWLQQTGTASEDYLMHLAPSGQLTTRGAMITGTAAWSSGTGAPGSGTPGYSVGGSMFSRTDGSTGSRLYISTGSAWNAVAGV